MRRRLGSRRNPNNYPERPGGLGLRNSSSRHAHAVYHFSSRPVASEILRRQSVVYRRTHGTAWLPTLGLRYAALYGDANGDDRYLDRHLGTSGLRIHGKLGLVHHSFRQQQLSNGVPFPGRYELVVRAWRGLCGIGVALAVARL